MITESSRLTIEEAKRSEGIEGAIKKQRRLLRYFALFFDSFDC
jgi:hypothetical protein